MRLYSYYRSTSSYRVRIVLNVKGVDVEYRPVDLKPAVSEQDLCGFDRVSPMRQVPVLEWQEGGATLRLTQSVAIAEFLEERYPEPALLPEGALERARVREIVEIVNSGIQPLQNTRTLAMVRDGQGEAAARSWAQEAIARGLGAIETLARAHPGEFVAGRTLSLAAVFMVPQLYNARRFGVDVAPFEKLVAVEAWCCALEPFLRAHPDGQPDAPGCVEGGES
jgi:maleylpyruvate isomerase